MNKRTIVIISLALIVIIVGIYIWQTSKPTNLQNIVLLPLVKGCAETDSGMATKSINEADERNATIEVNGNELIYSRAINHLCCRKAEIEKEAQTSIISIYEVWSGIGCKCMCFSEIEAKLQNIPPGTYTVSVYEKGTQSGSNEQIEQKLIISKNIVVYIK